MKTLSNMEKLLEYLQKERDFCINIMRKLNSNSVKYKYYRDRAYTIRDVIIKIKELENENNTQSN